MTLASRFLARLLELPPADTHDVTGEPLTTAKTLATADQAVFHDPSPPSALLLPVMG